MKDIENFFDVQMDTSVNVNNIKKIQNFSFFAQIFVVEHDENTPWQTKFLLQNFLFTK